MSLLPTTVEITLADVQRMEIHGSPYYQIAFKVQGQESLQQMRINPEAFYLDPQVGDRVEVNMLMGNVMGAKKLS